VRSIRRNLVQWLVGALVLGAVIVLAGTYALTRQQIGTLFDDELRQVALAVHVQEDWLQPHRVRIARPGFSVSVRAYDRSGRTYFETALPSLPADAPLTFIEGLSRIDTQEGTWRIYTHVTPEGIVQVGQPVARRDALARELSLPVLMPMLLLIPLLAALIAWVLQRGLAPLQETSRRVSDRDAARLDPLPTAPVPQELLPLVEQINALLGRLSSSLDAQRRFLADAAHELRSPVAALALQAQLAQRAQTPQARAAAFEELKRGTERCRRLVQQLLDFARLEPGVRVEADAPVDLAALAREVVGSHAAHADELGVDLGADAPAHAHVLGNEWELRSLIANLVDNALRYAPAGSAVTVSVLTFEERVELAVVDAGPGIPPGERERVFERFHRVAGDPTAGSGLGLSIAKAIAERHRGEIRLQDAAPGLAARVELPALRKKPGQLSAAPAVHTPPPPTRVFSPGNR
jgi:two-component system, OmpR family, sensor kinase